MLKVKPGTLTAGTLKYILNDQGLLQVIMYFHLWAQTEEHQHVAVVKQLFRIPTYFLTLPYTDQRKHSMYY